MKCPYCNYIDERKNEEFDEYGYFYIHQLKMIRPSESFIRNEDEAYLIGCPKCSKTFISTFIS